MVKTRVPFDLEECLECMLYSRKSVLSREEAREKIVVDRAGLFVESYARIAGLGDPLAREKQILNSMAMRIAGGIVFNGYRDLLALMALANGVDWGMKDYVVDYSSPSTILGDADRVVWLGDPLTKLQHARSIAIVLDNAGEALVDILAASWLMDQGKHVALIARSQPYEVDVTDGEARELVRTLGVGVDVYSTGSRYPVFHPQAYNSTGWRIVRESDIVLVKGIANFEAAVENPVDEVWGKLVFLLRAKCKPIASFFSVPLGTPLVVDSSIIFNG